MAVKKAIYPIVLLCNLYWQGPVKDAEDNIDPNFPWESQMVIRQRSQAGQHVSCEFLINSQLQYAPKDPIRNLKLGDWPYASVLARMMLGML